MEDEDLIQRVHNLPPELFNKIYEFTFTFSSSAGPVTIDKGYMPPHLLQVDRASRALFAQSYYGGRTVFRVDNTASIVYGKGSWLDSLPTNHLQMVHEAVATLRFATVTPRQECLDAADEYISKIFIRLRPHLGREALKFELHISREDGSEYIELRTRVCPINSAK